MSLETDGFEVGLDFEGVEVGRHGSAMALVSDCPSFDCRLSHTDGRLLKFLRRRRCDVVSG